MNINSRQKPPKPTYRLILEQIWRDAAVWPELAEVLQRALLPELSPASGDNGSVQFTWRHLPNLCCEALGGDPSLAEPISLAWGLLFTAAHFMDNVADGDKPPPSMADLGFGSMVNVATAFYACASLALLHDLAEEIGYERTKQVQVAFNQTILQMCSGQQLDLLGEVQSLETCWRIIRAKSGAIFKLACTTGAQIATRDDEVIAHFGEFGNHLGIMIQICDDAAELERKVGTFPPVFNFCTIPIAYTMEVLPEEDLSRFQSYVRGSYGELDASAKALAMVEDAGAGLYMQAKLQYHGDQAINALAATSANRNIRSKLAGFVKQLL